MPRKYRQLGYQDTSANRKRPPNRPTLRRSGESKPIPEPIQAREAFKCVQCGATQSVAGEPRPDEACTNCGSPIHSCVNCRFFDSSAPNECAQPVEVSIDAKRAANTCPLYGPRITVTLTRDPTAAKRADPRAAFEALFKK